MTRSRFFDRKKFVADFNTAFQFWVMTNEYEHDQVSLRGVAKEIGVQCSTLSRLRHGKIPSIDTFAKIVGWMKADAGRYFHPRRFGG